MLLGWHVDSNMAMRLSLIYGKAGDLGKDIFGYHCDHTRQITAAHSASRTANDWRFSVDKVERPDVPEQQQSWGCPFDEIEEIRLTDQRSKAYVSALKDQIGNRQVAPPIASYTGQSYNKTDYDPRHLLPFLADMFICLEKDTNVAWFGARPQTLSLFSDSGGGWVSQGKIMVESTLRNHTFISSSETTEVDFEALLADADVFVFDFGHPEDRPNDLEPLPSAIARVFARAFLKIVYAEHQRVQRGEPLRQIIAVNAINNVFERWVTTHIDAGQTPYATRLRHGFVLPLEPRMDWTDTMVLAANRGLLRHLHKALIVPGCKV